MSKEIKDLLKFNIQTLVSKTLQVLDENGSTSFTLSSVIWELYKSSDESLLDSGSGTVNNEDSNAAGVTIKTVSFSIDLRQTDDQARGSYYLVVETAIDSGQTDVFRIPVEIVDFRRKAAV